MNSGLDRFERRLRRIADGDVTLTVMSAGVVFDAVLFVFDDPEFIGRQERFANKSRTTTPRFERSGGSVTSCIFVGPSSSHTELPIVKEYCLRAPWHPIDDFQSKSEAKDDLRSLIENIWEEEGRTGDFMVWICPQGELTSAVRIHGACSYPPKPIPGEPFLDFTAEFAKRYRDKFRDVSPREWTPD